MIKKVLFASILLTVVLSRPASAIHLGASEDGKPLPWSRKMEHKLDQPVNDACKDTPFLMNLGPTGIRAMIEPDAPKALKVKYVFQDAKSPAKGLIKPGDWIIGANSKQFVKEHGFHRKTAGARGWQGPPFELALAIEDSQGSDGKLKLTVLEGGSPNKRKDVTLQLKPVGKFASTWPWNCPRSDALRKQLFDFLIENTDRGRIHIRVQHVLALYATGDKRAVPLFKEMGEKLAASRNDYHAGGMCTWGWGYQGIFLGEYYNIYKDNAVKPAVDALNVCYELGMDYGSGGFSHRPYPAIERRIAEGGPKGYGSMAGPGGLSMLAMSTFRAAGLPYSEEPYNRTHQAYLAGPGQNESGTLAYGFGGGWPSALIRLKSPASPCKSKEGVGYRCPTGMKNIGDFVVEKWSEEGGKWDKKLVPPTGEFAWLKSEADKLIVYESGHYLDDKNTQQRKVFRPVFLPEPTSAYNNNRKGGGHNAPVGMGALAHYIGNKGNTSWNYLGEHMAIGCAASPDTLWDGHASGEMHAFWAALGAFRAPEKDLRSFLDYTKTWIILSESHDGQGLIDQPFGCQRNSTCSIGLDRTAYTHVALMILSVPNRNLLITGADYAQPAGPTTAKPHTASYSPSSGSSYSSSTSSSSSSSDSGSSFAPASPEPPPVTHAPTRKARVLSEDNMDKLDDTLKGILSKLSSAGAIDKTPFKLSGTKQSVILETVSDRGTITIKQAQGGQTGELKWRYLTPQDRATLAALVAEMRPDSKDAQALAGVYLEAIGNVKGADIYYEKAGETATKKLEKLFN